VVIIEWASERFGERTARWCFGHLAALEPEELEEHGTWLHHARDAFAGSGLSWDAYLRAWVEEEGMHRGDQVVRGLDARFSRVSCVTGPYFFAELDGVSFGDEQAAIDAGLLEPVGIRYVGRAGRLPPDNQGVWGDGSPQVNQLPSVALFAVVVN
jgi:hypothetical protein